MATYYWVGGSGTWSTISNTKWSLSSGGAGGAGIPTTTDNVVFDANSNTGTGAFTVTVSGTVNCADFTASGLDGAMTLATAGNSVMIYGNYTGHATNLTWSGGGTFAHRGTTGGAKTINTNGGAVNNVSVSISRSSSGSTTFTSNFTTNSTISTGTNANINLSTYTITCGSWDASQVPATLTATSATIDCRGANFYGGNLTYGTVKINTSGVTGYGSITGSNTFSTLIVGAPMSNFFYLVLPSQTIGSLSLTGTTATQRVTFMTNNQSATRTTLTVSSISGMDYGGFRSIAIAGGALNWTAPSTFWDCGNNTGTTFTNTATLYWIGGTGNWNDTAHWSLSSGGSTAGIYPAAQTPVVFDANSNTGTGAFTVTPPSTAGAACKNFTASGLDGSMTLAAAIIFVYGNWNSPATNFTLQSFSTTRFDAVTGSYTINTNGVADLFYYVEFGRQNYYSGATWTLASNVYLQQNGQTSFYGGTLDLAGYRFNTGNNTSFSSNANKTLIFNGGTLGFNGTFDNGNYPAKATFTKGSGTGKIACYTSTTTNKTFYGGTSSVYPVNFVMEAASQNARLYNSFTIDSLENTASPTTISINDTVTISSASLNGSAGNLVSLQSVVAGAQRYLVCSSGTISVSYCTIKDSNASGGASFNAYTTNGNVDDGNNTGWNFTAPKSGGLFFGSNF